MVPVSLDRPFLIVPSVFSNVYLPINRYQNSMLVVNHYYKETLPFDHLK
jgi:hypothetical protein